MFVYLIRLSENSYYKIGVTKNINKRIKQLQTGNAEKIFLINSYESKYAHKIEKALHNFYFDKKKHNEWFELSIEDEVSFLKDCSKIENNIIYLDKNKI
jgi:predicted GIY-YIG superfamily endonuclease